MAEAVIRFGGAAARPARTDQAQRWTPPPGADGNSPKYRALAEALRTPMIRPDYDFAIARYQRCLTMARAVEAGSFPAEFKRDLREFYATEVIANGNQPYAG